MADISTTTETDGSFTLTNNHTQIHKNTSSPILIQAGEISFTLSEQTKVAISIYDLGGKQVYHSEKNYASGRHAIASPYKSTGIVILKVNIGNDAHVFKSSPFRTIEVERKASKDNSSALGRLAKATPVIADLISVVKEGQINYHDSIKSADTSGVLVTLIPNAGNLTDVDGNTYQTVQIGKQIWTVENIRTTTYNDGEKLFR